MDFETVLAKLRTALTDSKDPVRNQQGWGWKIFKAAEPGPNGSVLYVFVMTNLQEAKLAREAEICYTTIALVTDYDCWHPDHDSVTVEMVMSTLAKNAATAQQIIAGAVERLPYERTCECASALKYALVTRPEMVPDQLKKDLAPLIGRYISCCDRMPPAAGRVDAWCGRRMACRRSSRIRRADTT